MIFNLQKSVENLRGKILVKAQYGNNRGTWGGRPAKILSADLQYFPCGMEGHDNDDIMKIAIRLEGYDDVLEFFLEENLEVEEG